jgi:hypothetical protein
MKKKEYYFTQEQLEGFICFVIMDSLHHPNSTPKATIRRLYRKDRKGSEDKK